MLECRNVIMEKLTWNLGMGEEALFWSNSWGGYRAIETLSNFSASKAMLESRWGKYVKDYIETTNGDLGWKWKLVDIIDIPITEKVELARILSNRSITFNLGRDVLIWDNSKNGEYNMKEGYKYLVRKPLRPKSEIHKELCWDKYCLPKAGIFSWLAFHNRILT